MQEDPRSRIRSLEAGRLEITDDMVKAGVSAHLRWDPRFEEADGLVIAVFEAMLASLTSRQLDALSARPSPYPGRER